MDFYEYLNNKFGNCEILSDGTYYVNNMGNHYYFSSDCLETDVNLMVYHPGIGGLDNSHGNNSAALWNYQLKENGVPSGSVIMVSAHNSTSVLVDNFSVFDEVSSNAGIDVSNVQSVCFSGSGGTGIVRMGQYLAKHPELNDSAAIIDIDGYLFDGEMYKDQGASMYIRDNNIPIYMITPPSDSAYANRVKGLTANFTEAGFNTYLVVLDEKDFCIGHEEANRVVLNDGFSQYIGGASNELGTLAGYNVFAYKNGQLVSVNLEDARVGDVNYIGIDDIKEVLDDNEFTFEETSNDVKLKYNGLLTLGEFDISYNGDSNKMSSDVEYIENFSNGVINSLKDDSLFSSLTLSVSGGCGPLIEPINECLNLYYDTVGELINKLTLETEAIVSIGQSVADMDIYLKNNTPTDIVEDEVVSDDVVVDADDDVVDFPYVVPDQIIVDDGIITEEGTILEENELGVPEEEFITDSGELVEEEPIKQNEVPDNTDDLKISTQPPRQNDNNFISKEVVYEKNGYNLILEVSNDEIISIKYQYEFMSLEDALNNYNLLVDKYSSVNGIENIILNGNKVDIVFNTDMFDDMGYDEILSLFGV